jgi:hypothetical protein
MHRDFSKFISTDDDRRTVRKWVFGTAIFYGLAGLIVVGSVAVRNHQTDVASTAAAPAQVAIAINGHAR